MGTQTILQNLPLWAQISLLALPSIGAVSAAVGLCLNFWQSRSTNAQARAALVAGSLKGFAEDQEMQNAFYAIEYEEFRYDDGFHKSEQEREVDKLLRHFAVLALAWQADLLTIKDVKPIQYYVLRVMQNTEINRHLDFVANFSKENSHGEHPYTVLSKMCEKMTK